MFSGTIRGATVLLFALSFLGMAQASAADGVPVPDNQTYKHLENQLENRVDSIRKEWSDHNDSEPGTPLLDQQLNGVGAGTRDILLPLITFQKDAKKLVIQHESDWDEDASSEQDAEQSEEEDHGAKQRD